MKFANYTLTFGTVISIHLGCSGAPQISQLHSENPFDEDDFIHDKGVTEVTRGQWYAVMGTYPEDIPGNSCTPTVLGDSHPVACISYNDVVNAFLPRLNEVADDGYTYDLPEGSVVGGYYAHGLDHYELHRYAWFAGSIGAYETYPVATKQPTNSGHYDLNGNVHEMTHQSEDPGGTIRNRPYCEENCVVAHGCGVDTINLFPLNQECSSNFHDSRGRDERYKFMGFRLMRELTDENS